MAIVHDSKEMKKGHLKIIKFCLYNFKHLGSEDRNNFYSESIYLGEVMMSRKNLIVSLLRSHSSKVKKKFPDLGKASDRGRAKRGKGL